MAVGRGYRCEWCGGEGAPRCSACRGLGCSVLAEWARQKSIEVRCSGSGWSVNGFEFDRGVALLWALACEMPVVALGDGEVVFVQRLVEDIAALPRPLCTLPERWEAQIDIRLEPVFIPALRRSGSLVEAARVRAEAARVRHEADERLEATAESERRHREDLEVIRKDIAGIDPFEPAWHTDWWLAFREWTSAGKPPDPDALAEVLRGLGYERVPAEFARPRVSRRIFKIRPR